MSARVISQGVVAALITAMLFLHVWCDLDWAKPVVVTLWDSFATTQGIELDKLLRIGNYPLILAKRLGISLTTCYDASIQINPTGSRAALLKEWRSANTEMIQQLLLQNAHADSLIALGQPLNQPSVSISEAMNCYDEVGYNYLN
ncbi:unnamed protein product [Cuscuta epithymum]|uniref:Uncharacterized protein n=1 Tax=Cuscuta epithymum TaxID=186058 RepID=A0AAV0FGU6_9ASTE|nr:unnamed protein product [Cuscuta epithymum]